MSSIGNNREQISLITRILTSVTSDGNVKLQSIKNLKTFFKPPEKTLGNIKLKYLLQEGGVLLKSDSHERDFLITYSTKLINYVGRDITLDLELLKQLEYIFLKLQHQDENLIDKLYIKICQIQNKSFLCCDGIMKIFNFTFERRLLDWITSNKTLEMEFLTKMCANSPKLFQTVSSILYSILVKAVGHWRVFEVTTTFISSVFSVCTKNGKDFIGLYPENCRRIVSLLIVPPDLYSDKIIKNEVLTLLTDMFLLDKKRTLILLSHYSDWLCVFKDHFLNENTVKTKGF